MREKLLALMQNEGLKPSQLAEMLGVNPAGISHILAGRNKPGFDLLQKILRRFPRIDPDWLLLDSDRMYRENFNIETQAVPIKPKDLFGSFQRTSENSSDAVGSFSGTTIPQPPSETGNDLSAQKSEAVRIERIVVFYSNQTFEYFLPKK